MSGERISFCGEEAPLPTCTQHEQWARSCRTTSEIHPPRPHDSVANIWLRSTKHQNAEVRSLQPSVTALFFFCRVIGFLQRRQLIGGGAQERSFPPSVKQQQVTNRPRHRISGSTRPPHLIGIRTVIYSVWDLELSLTEHLTSPSVYSLNIDKFPRGYSCHPLKNGLTFPT